MRLFLLTVTLFMMSFSAHSLDNASPRNFTLSSGFVERVFNDNKALVDFPLSAIQSYGKLFDTATPSFTNQWWSRLLTSLVELPISYWFTQSIFIPFHEFGHARSAQAFGKDYSYSTYGYGMLLREDISTYWELSLWRLFTPPFFFPGQGMAGTDYYGKGSPLPADLERYWGNDLGARIVSAAAGLNNQSFLAKKLAEDIYENGGHITYFQQYVGNKLSGFVYSQMNRATESKRQAESHDDISTITKSYQAKGYHIENKHIEMQSLLSLVSGTTFALLKGYYDYVAHGNPVVLPVEVFGVRLPDLNSYINARGLSFEIVSGYRWSKDLFFDLAYEFIWKGESAHQVTPSAHYNLASLVPAVNELWIQADLVIAKGMGGSLDLNYAPFPMPEDNFWHRLTYFADLTVYNSFNLFGERNSPVFTNASGIAVSGFAGIKLRY